eukprot:scaffold32663_cov30-Tisochrysis_lutea.AAC.2
MLFIYLKLKLLVRGTPAPPEEEEAPPRLFCLCSRLFYTSVWQTHAAPGLCLGYQPYLIALQHMPHATSIVARLLDARQAGLLHVLVVDKPNLCPLCHQ